MLAWVMNLGFAGSNASADVNEYLFYYHKRRSRSLEHIMKGRARKRRHKL